METLKWSEGFLLLNGVEILNVVFHDKLLQIVVPNKAKDQLLWVDRLLHAWN